MFFFSLQSYFINCYFAGVRQTGAWKWHSCQQRAAAGGWEWGHLCWEQDLGLVCVLCFLQTASFWKRCFAVTLPSEAFRKLVIAARGRNP